MTEVALASEAMRADPYPAYDQLRRTAPVFRATGPMGSVMWLVTRYEDARAVLADQRFAKHPKHAPQWVRDIGIFDDDNEGPTGINLLSSDVPDHTRLRRLVTKAFTRRRIEALRPRVQEVTDALLDELKAGTEVDLLAALAVPLPITIICELLGVPPEDRNGFRAWSKAMLSPEMTPEGMAGQQKARLLLEEYVGGLIANAREKFTPTDDLDELPDLISALVFAADQEDRLGERELIGMVELLLVAGHETTVNLIGNGTLALLRHPDQLDLLRAQPELMPSAIEELLRYDGPLERATPRFTTEEVEIAGVTIPANSAVSVVLAAADRDPAYAEDADRLDITRSQHSHLAFGHGLHFCLGAPLARLEGQVAIGSLVRRFPDLALARPVDELRWRPGGVSSVIRGMEEFPVTL
jgi:cytochrome P450